MAAAALFCMRCFAPLLPPWPATTQAQCQTKGQAHTFGLTFWRGGPSTNLLLGKDIPLKMSLAALRAATYGCTQATSIDKLLVDSLMSSFSARSTCDNRPEVIDFNRHATLKLISSLESVTGRVI